MRRPGRLHARSLPALVDPPALLHGRPTITLRAPQPGVFVPAIDTGDMVPAGSAIGTLVVLGQSFAVIAAQVTGFAVQLVDPALTTYARRTVGYGDILAALDLSPSRHAAGGEATSDPSTPHTAASVSGAGAAGLGLVFRAPTSGRFYGRSAPDKPPFVVPGAQLTHGATICLIEVMKTFSRVTYGGSGLPDTARVVRVLVAEGADVNAGEPLLELD
jgi:acetyl-CoA carboxylase biotin carboxyl carrier protein